jgi:hypothetical protein
VTTDGFWSKFRRWRRHRPFWGGLFLLLSAGELFLTANMSLGGIQIHLGPQGFLSYLLPVILLICGLLTWFSPAQRLFYGIVALLAALYSFIGLNLGGFGIGMLLGIVGGGLVIAWGPPRVRPDVPDTGAPPTGEPGDHGNDVPDGEHDDGEHDDETRPTEPIEIAGHDDRPHEPVRPATQEPGIVPGFPQRTAPPGGMGRLGKSPRAVAVALIPLAGTATIIVAGSSLPASAEDCPDGLPSRATTATATTAATTTGAAAAAAAPAAAKAKKKATATSPAPHAGASTSASAPAAAAKEDDKGNPIINGIENFIDGVGNLLGINDDESSPSASPSPSETASPTAEPTTTTTKPAEPTTTASPGGSAQPGTGSAATSSPPKPSATDSEIPCLGARIYGKVAGADDIPLVSQKPGVMKVGSLTMYNSTYDGVVDIPTAGGSYKALKFSMDKAVNKPFSLTIEEKGNAHTVITSDELTTTGTVKFYTPSFKGKLFGLIPVTFTPDSPPPLTLPILWFTDVEIQLAFVRCDTLTGDPLRVRETVG